MKKNNLRLSFIAIIVIVALSMISFSTCEEKDKIVETIKNMINWDIGVQLEAIGQIRANEKREAFNIVDSGCKNQEKYTRILNDSIEDGAHIEFVNGDLHVYHKNLLVPCDYDTIYIKTTFNNTTLTILEEGNNGYVNCICPVDLTYFINDVDRNQISLIIINFDTIYNNSK